MIYTSDHTQGDSFIQYEFTTDKSTFTQNLYLDNPDLEIQTI